MKISITQGDIEKGKACNAFACPIHRAIERATGWQDDFSVLTQSITKFISDTKYGTVAILPPEARDFIELFDEPVSRHLCRPFEFELNL